MRGRFLSLLGCCCLALLTLPAAGGTQSFPVEKPRIRQSHLTAVSLPSFGLLESGNLRWYDNFFALAQLNNLRSKGWNVNLSLLYRHRIHTLYPPGLPIAQDSLTGLVRFSLTRSTILDVEAEWLRLRQLHRETSAVWDGSRLRSGVAILVDRRTSRLENAERGKTLIYPQGGFLVGLQGEVISWLPAADVVHSSSLPRLGAIAAALAGLGDRSTLRAEVVGRANLRSALTAPLLLTCDAVPVRQPTGDWMARLKGEYALLFPRGATWESPPFWYLSSFLFRFLPGITLTAQGGVVGGEGEKPHLVASLLAGPQCAIRIEGTLWTLIRLSMGAAFTGGREAVFTLVWETPMTGGVPLVGN